MDELVVCIHNPDPTGTEPRGRFWNKGSYSDLDRAVADILSLDALPTTTVYFGVGRFANHRVPNANGGTKIQRKQEQATMFKALALDLDIGGNKPYQTQKEGWLAMRAALENLGMPTPMVVSSGNGIHLYWPLQTAIDRDTWVRVSVALRLALQEQGVVIDTSKIHDPSMVLRPVGTHHKKQEPWKPVRVLLDCEDHDLFELAKILKPWFNKQLPANRPAVGKPAKQSSIAAAVLNSNDVILTAVASRCAQVRALVDSGGVTNAMGRAVEEPMWRLTLGLAKHCTDPQEAVIMIAGKHPDFDLDHNMAKMQGWHGSGPPTCQAFDQQCGNVCASCPHNGKIKSPAQLSFVEETVVTPPAAAEPIVMVLPKPYVLKDNKVYIEVQTESDAVDANGNKTGAMQIEHELVSEYELHVTGAFFDRVTGQSSFRLLANYPHEGWRESDHRCSVLASAGKDFSSFLLDRQLYVKHLGQQEKIRSYLVDYLSMVQKQSASGQDYLSFGWQDDGSFLCGERVLGAPGGAVERRLKGPAAQFTDRVRTAGTRDGWVDGMRMLNHPGASTIRAAVLIAMSGVLGTVAGNATGVLSIYSNRTTTGKSLSLIAANSLIGHPKYLFMNQKDTHNALYKIRGVLNHLPCTIDELTAIDDAEVVDLVYHLSQGREKTRMYKDGQLHEPAVWNGPTIVSTNISLHQKFSTVQSQSEPLKTRTLELHQHDRSFVETDDTGSSHGYRFFEALEQNHGWAMPELVEAVLAMGGPKVAWEKGEAAFMRRFNFLFEPQERFYRTSIVSGWIMGKLGERLGLIPFDVDATAQFLLDHVASFRKHEEDNREDVFDTIGQFLQEHNDQLIEVTEEYGSGKKVVRHPAPERAVARIEVVYDKNNVVMPGSILCLNSASFKRWLSRARDGIDRVVHELRDEGALVDSRARVTMFKGVKDRNPGQAHCVVININHPRFVQALTGTSAKTQSPIALSVLQGKQA